MTPAARADAEAAMPRVPPELHRLLLWLLTGQDPAGGNASQAA